MSLSFILRDRLANRKSLSIVLTAHNSTDNRTFMCTTDQFVELFVLARIDPPLYIYILKLGLFALLSMPFSSVQFSLIFPRCLGEAPPYDVRIFELN